MARTSTTTFSLRLTAEERALLDQEAARLGMKPAALGRALLLRGLQDGDSPKAPAQLRQLAIRLGAIEEAVARIDVNLYNAAVIGLQLATGEEKLASSGDWIAEHLQGDDQT